MTDSAMRIEVFLDAAVEPVAVYESPATFDLDTRDLPDGPHELRVRAIEASGLVGEHRIPFMVRNGPGIDVQGLRPHDVVESRVRLLVNAYASDRTDPFEARLAETPAPVPTWAWVLCLVIGAWALFYAVSQWAPPLELRHTPTFSAPTQIVAPSH